MSKPITLQTAFATYAIGKSIGEGGSGVVHEADQDGKPFAVKILPDKKATSDKLKRFKNEIAFLQRSEHPNIVRLHDHGRSTFPGFEGSFYVMPRYAGSLRPVIGTGLAPKVALSHFYSILDGVEAAHLLGTVHRDLKPENILLNTDARSVAVADFGIASFKTEELWTLLETKANQRLANHAYAAPEQRDKSASVGIPADIFALGLMLNELVTGQVPYGENYKKIASISPEHAYLDRLIERMIQRDAGSRPQSIGDVRGYLQRYESEYLTQQKLDELSKVVIPEGENPDPLAHRPPKITNVDWEKGRLTLFFDSDLSNGFIDGLFNMSSQRALQGQGPQQFNYAGNWSSTLAREEQVQPIVDYFKVWLPEATRAYADRWKREQELQKQQRLQQLENERHAEETRLRVLQNVQF